MKELLNKQVFHIFDVNLGSKLVFMHEHVMNNQEHIRTFKHIQENLNNYYYALILNSHHGNTKNKLRKRIIPSCNVHTVEEKTLGRGLKGEGKEELGEEE